MNPKTRFLKTKESKLFADIATSEAFLLALDYGLLELQARLPDADDPAKSWTAHARISGGRQLCEILKLLSMPDEIDKPTKQPQLNYAAYNKPARNS